MLDDKPDILCEKNRCLMDQEVIDRINILENPGWIARNYSKFWGHTLDEGIKYSLGTLSPAFSVIILY